MPVIGFLLAVSLLSGPPQAAHSQIASVAFNPAGTMLAAGGYRGVNVFDPTTGRQVAHLPGLAGTAASVKFSADGKWLAAGGGLAGRTGEVMLLRLPFSAKPKSVTLTGPTDIVQSIAFSPNGRYLAAASYDHDVTIWDLTAGNPKPRILKDHTDSVYAVAFSPDGKLIASAGGDRTVKVWSAATGKRLFTLSESAAEVYSLAFRPDGKQIAAGGADKQLRTWDISATAGKLVKSAFAHNGAILGVAYSHDGRSIVTAGEDDTVKRWDGSTLVEQKVYPKLPDWPQGIALSPNGKLLAVGCHNGLLALYDAGSGRLVREPLRGTPVAANSAATPRTSAIPGRRMGDNKQRRPVNNGGVTLVAASLGDIAPRGVSRAATGGGTIRFTLFGGQIADASRVVFDDPGITARIVAPPDSNPGVLRVDASLSASTRLGIHQVFVQTPNGTTGAVPFAVGGWPEVGQAEPNNAPGSAQRVTFPCTVVGALDTPGDVDCYRFVVKAGQELVFEVIAQQLRSRLQPVLTLLDGEGKTLAESGARIGRPDALLGYRFTRDGSYVLRLRDYESAGGPDVHYRLNVGEFPVVTDIFPLGARAGATTEVEIRGFNLGGTKTARVVVPASASPGASVPVALETLRGPLYLTRSLEVGSDPEVSGSLVNLSTTLAQPVSSPCAINGRIVTDQQHYYRFHAAKGRQLTIEVLARRAGSPLDSEIEVLDAAGKPVERAVIRPVYQTEVTLNDRDSATNALRIFGWDGVRIGDYMMVGREVVRVVEMPRGPDSDIFFRTFRGQRLTYFGTTPEYHSVGQPVYKVEVHPAGASFSPNGYPVTRLTYRNDDGGPVFGKDSHLDFVAPADGDYFVSLRDTRGQYGPEYAYRLLIHPPRPDYRLSFNPPHPNVPKAGAIVLNVECERVDGFDGAIALNLEGLPPGFNATSTEIEPGETSATLLIAAAPDAVSPASPVALTLVGRARIGGREVVRSVGPGPSGRLVMVLPQPDARVATAVQTLTIHPGEEVSLDVLLDRQGKFGGRVPIEIKNLPFGVQVQNVGLNGILVTEEDSSRIVSIRCEPWVKAQTRLFYVVANIEGGVPNAGPPVLLTVAPTSNGAAPRAALARRK